VVNYIVLNVAGGQATWHGGISYQAGTRGYCDRKLGPPNQLFKRVARIRRQVVAELAGMPLIRISLGGSSEHPESGGKAGKAVEQALELAHCRRPMARPRIAPAKVEAAGKKNKKRGKKKRILVIFTLTC